jgi:hypothetical protein
MGASRISSITPVAWCTFFERGSNGYFDSNAGRLDSALATRRLPPGIRSANLRQPLWAGEDLLDLVRRQLPMTRASQFGLLR